MTDAMIETLTGFKVGFPLAVGGFVVCLLILALPLVGVSLMVDGVRRFWRYLSCGS